VTTIEASTSSPTRPFGPRITATPPPNVVLAASSWPNNAALIADLARLGYLKDKDTVLDATYGRGSFWRTWRPLNLVERDRATDPTWNYEAMDYGDCNFDVIVLDPPYKLHGTPAMGPMDDRYGTGEAYTRWQDRHAGIKRGIDESLRVLVPGGILLLKCMDQVCSGQVRWQTIEFSQHAVEQGARLVDMFHYLDTPRSQPGGRRQVHARRNFSTALILRKAS
jgi:hypothetical protein